MEEVYGDQFDFNSTCTTSNLNSGQIFLMTIGFFFVGTVVPAWFTGYFLYPELDDDDIDEEIPYEKKYNLDECKNDGNKDNIDRNILLESTPQGKICMKYSNEEEGFEYWSDKPIDYKYLETAARKYVNTFSYKDLYIDKEKMMKEKVDTLKDLIDKNRKLKAEGIEYEEESEDAEEDDENSVFIKKKNEKKKKPLKMKIEKDDLVVEKANKYIKRGRFDDANWFKPKPKVDDNKAISYRDWFFMNNKADLCQV